MHKPFVKNQTKSESFLYESEKEWNSRMEM